MIVLQIILFIVLLCLFIAGLILIFVTKKFNRPISIVLLIIILIGLIYVAQQGGKVTYKLGPLIATVEKSFGDTEKFTIKNPTNEPVQEKFGFATSDTADVIKNVSINKGNDFISVIDGGVGNNYIIYSVNITANETASGVVVSSSGIFPQFPDLGEKK